MAEQEIPRRTPPQDAQYLRLLKGEISSAEFVKTLKAEVRRTPRRGGGRTSASQAATSRQVA